jgi:hypothetical protein
MEEMALCVIPTALLVAIFGTIVALRWFKHREIMAMVEKGMVPQRYDRSASAVPRRNGRGLLAWGIVMAALGLALVAGLWPIGFARAGMGTRYPLNFGPWMLMGLIPFAFGLALLIIYFLLRKEDDNGSSSAQIKEPQNLVSPEVMMDSLEE